MLGRLASIHFMFLSAYALYKRPQTFHRRRRRRRRPQSSSPRQLPCAAARVPPPSLAPSSLLAGCSCARTPLSRAPASSLSHLARRARRCVPPIYAAINRQTSVGRLARALSLQSLLALLQFSRAHININISHINIIIVRITPHIRVNSPRFPERV